MSRICRIYVRESIQYLRGGILIEFKEYNYALKNIIAEGYDYLIGYYIFSLQLINKRNNFSYFNLTDDFNSVAIVNNNLIAMFDFYGVHGRVQNGRERFTIANINKLSDGLIDRKLMELNCYYVEKQIMKYFYLNIGNTETILLII